MYPTYKHTLVNNQLVALLMIDENSECCVGTICVVCLFVVVGFVVIDASFAAAFAFLDAHVIFSARKPRPNRDWRDLANNRSVGCKKEVPSFL